jgi:DNA polymerase-1
MLEPARRLPAEKVRSETLPQTHDELILECPEDELDEIEGVVIECMEHVSELDVPLKVEVSRGANLAAVKD